MRALLTIASPAFMVFHLFFFSYPPLPFLVKLSVRKSASVRGRSVDLKTDAGKCQLSNSEQHPSIRQLQKKAKSLAFPN